MIKYEYKTMEEVSSLVDVNKELFFDTETAGLYGPIMLAQFFQEGWEAVILVSKPTNLELIILLAKTNTIMHNASYDLSTLQRQSKTAFVPDRFEDTLYLSRIKFFGEDSFSLDSVMSYVLRYDPYEKAGLVKSEQQSSDWTKELTPEQELYACIDVFHLLDVYNCIKDGKDNFIYQLDIISLKEALLWQCNGLPIDRTQLDRQFIANKQGIEEEALPVNCNSFLQVREYIGSNNSDDIGLARESYEGNERAKKVRKVRKLVKQQSFLRKFDVQEGRIYGIFAPSARSGRYTCKEQNLQQNPRKLKHVFGVAPDADTTLVYSDYPGLELRGACVITGERKMEKLFREFEDLHDYTARTLFGDNFTPEQRQIAKTANFALLYGASWKILGVLLLKESGLYLHESDLKKIKSRWNGLWSTITAWQEAGIKKWRNGMAGSTPLGRRYKAKMMTDFLNMEVQGFGAEVAKLAKHYMIKELVALGWYNKEVKLINFVHDSYFFEVKKDPEIYEKVAEVVARCMQQSWFSCCENVMIKDLPMPIKVTVGHNVKGIDTGDYIYKLELEGMHYYKEVA